jgi:hypothetical protein
MDVNVEPFIAAGEPRDKERFKTVRDESYWILREALQPSSKGKQRIKLPDDKELINQLTSIKFKYSSDGRIKIEGKDEMKKRGLKSPDKADALVMALYFTKEGLGDRDSVGFVVETL